MTEDELPSWLLKDVDEVEQMEYEESEGKLFATGKRQRKEVDYSESLTEKEWLKALEDGNIEQAEEKKKKRRRKRRDVAIADEPKVNKEEVVFSLLIVFVLSSQTKRKSGSSSRAKLTRMMIRLWELTVEARDDNGRIVSDIFMMLPTRRELPQYYQIIKKPIDLKKIKVSENQQLQVEGEYSLFPPLRTAS